MKAVFADTYYFLALLNSNDAGHTGTASFTADFDGKILTTSWVLTEVVDAMSHPDNRALIVDYLSELKSSPAASIEPLSETLAQEGLNLFAARMDKHWSLTDCISFVVMQREGIIEALTADRHFEQAGFRALLK